MKVGIVGLGHRLSYLARVFTSVDPELRIVGYADPEPFGLDYVHQHSIDVGRAHDSLGGLLAAERLDLLMIGSPNHLHLDHITEALDATMPIFCEKPVVGTEAQTYALLRLLADGADRRILMGLVMRYTTLYQDVMAAIRDGTIGEISSLEAAEHIQPYHGAFFMRDWRRYEELSGSFLLEKCCHDLDMYQSFVGCRAQRVASFGGRRSFIPRLGNLEDREIHHSKAAGWNGAAAVFHSDADIVDSQTAIVEYANGASMAFHTNMNVPDFFRRFCVVGSHGMAEGDFIRNTLRIHATPSGRLLLDRASYHRTELGIHYGGDERMAADICGHLRDGRALPVSVYDALEAGLTAIKIDDARRTRSLIDLTETWRMFGCARRRRMTRRRGTALFAYALLAPSLLYLLAIIFYPLLDTVILAFTNASLRPVSRFVGVANFAALLNASFLGVVGLTVLWTAASVALKMLIGLAGALLLNARVPGRNLFRVLIMPPWIVPIAIGAFMWGWMYNGQFGMISGLLQRAGLSSGPVAFLGYPALAFWATIVTDVWVGLPLVILYLLAALQSIPEELLEAAWVDGAGRLQRLRHIVLPLLWPAIGNMTLLSTIFTFRSFDPIWILTGGGPSDATDTLIIDTYRVAFGRFRYGEGAARTVVLCVLLTGLALLYLRGIARAERQEGLA